VDATLSKEYYTSVFKHNSNKVEPERLAHGDAHYTHIQQSDGNMYRYCGMIPTMNPDSLVST